jgi:hypothetical protein
VSGRRARRRLGMAGQFRQPGAEIKSSLAPLTRLEGIPEVDVFEIGFRDLLLEEKLIQGFRILYRHFVSPLSLSMKRSASG